uniref:Uncharacterized protein n=1 Tax=Molossus molossus TaxID=27622 RepID=A0A7J8J001_MOLMO|nr:hypothetical protein HJG59_010244 [Molossus molossus]
MAAVGRLQCRVLSLGHSEQQTSTGTGHGVWERRGQGEPLQTPGDPVRSGEGQRPRGPSVTYVGAHDPAPWGRRLEVTRTVTPSDRPAPWTRPPTPMRPLTWPTSGLPGPRGLSSCLGPSAVAGHLVCQMLPPETSLWLLGPQAPAAGSEAFSVQTG